VLIGSVVQHHFHDHADAALVGRPEEKAEVVEIAVIGVTEV